MKIFLPGLRQFQDFHSTAVLASFAALSIAYFSHMIDQSYNKSTAAFQNIHRNADQRIQLLEEAIINRGKEREKLNLKTRHLCKFANLFNSPSYDLCKRGFDAYRIVQPNGTPPPPTSSLFISLPTRPPSTTDGDQPEESVFKDEDVNSLFGKLDNIYEGIISIADYLISGGETGQESDNDDTTSNECDQEEEGSGCDTGSGTLHIAYHVLQNNGRQFFDLVLANILTEQELLACYPVLL